MFHQPDNSINWSQHRAELLALRKHFSAIISFRTHRLSTLVFSKRFSLNCDNFCDKLELKRDRQWLSRSGNWAELQRSGFHMLTQWNILSEWQITWYLCQQVLLLCTVKHKIIKINKNTKIFKTDNLCWAQWHIFSPSSQRFRQGGPGQPGLHSKTCHK